MLCVVAVRTTLPRSNPTGGGSRHRIHRLSILKPLRALDLLQGSLVEVRHDLADECPPDLLVIAVIGGLAGELKPPAMPNPAGWQVDRCRRATDRDEAREPDRVLADRNAEHIVVALPDGRTNIAEIIHVGDLALANDLVPFVEEVGGAVERLARHVAAELQQQERGCIIRGVVASAPDRYFKIVEHGER